MNWQKEAAKENSTIEFYEMNAIDLKFNNYYFDKVICVQNGISAFHVDPKKLIKEAICVTRIGGTILFSSYSEKFWEDRLNWFEIQAQYGLIGKIDHNKTGNGIIICKDGFKAITYTKQDFHNIVSNLKVQVTIHEIDHSSVFCELVPY